MNWAFVGQYAAGNAGVFITLNKRVAILEKHARYLRRQSRSKRR